MADPHSQAAQHFVSAYERDPAALARLNEYYGRQFSFDDVRAEIWRRVYAFRQRSSRQPTNYLLLEEAQLIVAQDAGYGNWEALLASGGKPTEAFVLHPSESCIGPRRRLSNAEWDALLAAARAHRIQGLEANGLMTDDVLRKVTALDHVTHLNLGGSRELTDDGLLALRNMPQLERLTLSEYPGGKLTDRGLAVLQHLTQLKSFEMTWQAGISDAGVAHLRHCTQLENVNLMGSPTGDGAIHALAGLPRLRNFSTGRLVTDAALPALHDFPLLKQLDGEGAKLLLDGPFTDQGLATLAGLAGIAELDLFWHVKAVTPAGFAHLAGLPNLQSLGADGALSGDEAMPHIAAIPRLRQLRAQESTATDDGFVALSHSQTLAGLWGRECPHFGSRGFRALSAMPSLERLGIGCAQVDDDSLATLPHFPALRQLTPIGFRDEGFRHIGRCHRLERLTCMYCRDTTDAATAHLSDLNINYYYAGLTQITDRSLELLGRLPSLEQVDLYECQHVTDAGLPHLAALPKLREVHLDGLPKVTLPGTRIFPKHVQVFYSA